jgi:hypothetical protein
MKASEIAYRAAEIMSERGHCKNILEDPEGRVCYLGALNRAACGNIMSITSNDFLLVLQAMKASARILTEDGIRGPLYAEQLPVFWNNRKTTTGEDVILLLKETGRRLEEDGD